jgi:hypothetical protein
MTQPQAQTNTPATPPTGPSRDPRHYQTQIQDVSGGGARQDFGSSSNWKNPLADLGMYLQTDPFKHWKTGDGGFDEIAFDNFNRYNGVSLYRKNAETGKWEINPEGRLGELNRMMPNLNFRLENDPYREDYQDGRPSMNLMWNHEAIPRDAFGNYGTSVQGEFSRNGLYRPELQYDDPLYGRITPRQNLRPDDGFMDGLSRMVTRTPLLLSLASMGLGGALGGAGLLGGGFNPSTIMSLGQGASGALQGDFSRMLQALVSAGLPMTGLSGLPLNMARMGSGFFSNMLRNNSGGGRG